MEPDRLLPIKFLLNDAIDTLEVLKSEIWKIEKELNIPRKKVCRMALIQYNGNLYEISYELLDHEVMYNNVPYKKGVEILKIKNYETKYVVKLERLTEKIMSNFEVCVLELLK